MTSLSYAGFLALFLVIPLAISLSLLSRTWSRGGLIAVGLTLLISLPAAALWDESAAGGGLWRYGATRIWGIWLGHIPLEEIAFFTLQITLVALLCEASLARARS